MFVESPSQSVPEVQLERTDAVDAIECELADVGIVLLLPVRA